MRLLILLVALTSTTLAQQRGPQRSARTPQAQVRYNDPNGLKVDWKFFVPPNPVRLPETSQRAERGQPVHPQHSLQQHLRQPLQQHRQQPLQQRLQQPLQQHLQQQLQQAPQQHLLQPLHQHLQQPLQQQLQQQLQQAPQHHLQQQLQQAPQQHLQRQLQDASQQHLQQQLQQAPQQHLQRQLQDASQQHLQQQLQQVQQSQLVQHQPDPESQIQYKAYLQVQAPAQAHPELNQVHYKAYSQAQAPAEAQSDSSQLQYKATTQAEIPVEAQLALNQISYKPYPEAPAHVKQLVYESSKPQRPDDDPIAILYNSNYDQQSNTELPQYEKPTETYEPAEQQKSRRDYSSSGLQGRIVYKNEQPQEQQLSQLPQLEQLAEPVHNIFVPPPPKLLLDKNMPSDLQQLLIQQAQSPYNVIANNIKYTPKALFVPEPLPEGGKGPYSYRSRTYYVYNDQYQPIYDESKPVREEERH